MKLGIFDSGLGGLIIAKALAGAFPNLDIMYLGDTLHLPYGNRSGEAIYEHAKCCMDYMFAQDCRMIIMGCNTASASALRHLQQNYLPEHYPERRILGVIVPTIEHALDQSYTRLGLIGTNFTLSTKTYEEELQKINPAIKIFQQKTPLLVPLLEHEGGVWLDDVLEHYLEPLVGENIEALLLGCTHYALLKERIRARYGFDVISQDEIIPPKLAQYFVNHPEIHDDIGKHGACAFYVTDLTDNYQESAQRIYGAQIALKHVEL